MPKGFQADAGLKALDCLNNFRTVSGHIYQIIEDHHPAQYEDGGAWQKQRCSGQLSHIKPLADQLSGGRFRPFRKAAVEQPYIPCVQDLNHRLVKNFLRQLVPATSG